MKTIMGFLAIILIFMVAATTACALGPKIVKGTAEWDAPTTNVDGSPLTDLGGYFLYWKSGTAPYSDTNRRDVGNVTSFNLRSLALPPAIYTIMVGAYDTEGNESAPSNEVAWDAVLPGSPNNKPVKP